MSYRLVPFIFLGLLLMISACANRTEPSPTPIPLTSYQNESAGFAVQYPATWHIRETEEGIIELKSDLATNLDASYSGGSVVQIMSLPQLFTADQDPLDILNSFSDQILTLIRSEDAASAVLSAPTATVINGQSAAGMLISARQGTTQTYAEVYIITQNNQTALLMLVYPQTQAVQFRDSLDLIVNRFQLLGE